MKLSSKQKAIIYGLALGDAYLQKTGEKNARLRIEHSYKQKDYVEWKYQQLRTLFASKPKVIARVHPKSKRTYQYVRLQSHSSPFLGALRRLLYDSSGKRIVKEGLEKILNSALTLAVWYMDDGYYYARDKSAHIYIPQLRTKEINHLVDVLVRQYHIKPTWYCRPDRKVCQLNVTGQEKEKFFRLVKPYVLPFFNYKLPLTP